MDVLSLVAAAKLNAQSFFAMIGVSTPVTKRNTWYVSPACTSEVIAVSDTDPRKFFPVAEGAHL